MRFRVKEVSGKPRPVFLGRSTVQKKLLSHLLPYRTESVLDLLQEIAFVEKGISAPAHFEGEMIDGEIHADRVMIEYLQADVSGKYPRAEMSLDEFKLLLFEWGTALQRWMINRAKITEKGGRR